MTTLREHVKKILKEAYLRLPFKRGLFRLIKIFYTPPNSVYRHLHFKGVIKIKVEDKHFYMRHYGYEVENELFWEGIYKSRERVVMQSWVKLCYHFDAILDVGSNTGVYAMVASTLNPKAGVFCFEPVKRVMDKCRYNCLLNNYNIGCFDLAVSDYDGFGMIYDLPTEHIYGVEVNKNINPSHLKSIEVKIVTKKLETFFKEHNIRSALLKVDVEYHLPQVIKGIGDSVRPVIMAEVLTDDVGRQTQGLLKDYIYFDLSGNSPVRTENIAGSTHCNYLLIPKECEDTVTVLLGNFHNKP